MTNRTEMDKTTAAASRRAAWRWGSLIIGLLVLQVGLCVAGVVAATRGKAVVVEADYYNKALKWDEDKAARQASLALGWDVDIEAGNTATERGERALIVSLKDKEGKAIDGAKVKVAYFHHAKPMELRQAELKGAEGRYAASVPLNTRGVWEFRVLIEHKGEKFIETVQKDLFE